MGKGWWKRRLAWLLIAGLSLSCGLPARGQEVVDPRSETMPARFLVQLGPEQDRGTLESVLRSLYGEDVRFEPLFTGEKLTESMRRMYLVRRPALRAGETPWDAAYRLRDEGGFEAVVPDRNDTLVAQTREALETGRCFSDPGVPTPADPEWSVKRIRATEAWRLSPRPGGKAQGEGIRVCHPDTGWAEHVDLDAGRLDLDHDFDFVDSDDDARDPLDYHFRWASRGHGTATGSVIMSGRGGGVTGVAPKATLVPIRTVKSVVQFFDSDVARAVQHATQVGCDVISMSLGGAGFFGLEAAVDQAVAQGIVVVAAAGNCVPWVVAPASYANTIAVAATNAEDAPWHGSSRGGAVDLSAPGEDVYRAIRDVPGDGTTAVGPSDGTSYATAEVAGAAALWLAHHGRSAVEAARRCCESVNDVFRRVVTDTADDSPAGWDKGRFGRGILDALALLETELGSGAPTAGVAPERAPETDLAILARVIDRNPAPLRRLLRSALREGEDPERYAAELLELAYRDPQGLMAFLDPADGTPPRESSNRLRRALRPRHP